jgi:hypothetical protein
MLDHSGRHTTKYHQDVYRKLSDGLKGGKRGFITALMNVRKDLISGALSSGL